MNIPTNPNQNITINDEQLKLPTNSPIWRALLAVKMAPQMILKAGLIRLGLIAFNSLQNNPRDLL